MRVRWARRTRPITSRERSSPTPRRRWRPDSPATEPECRNPFCISGSRRTLGRWRERPAASPFRLDAPGATEHFLHGALAPVMGLFPGGCRELSRLVHTLRSGAVIRAVRDVATDDAQRVFAWGWLTHAPADAEIHPLVNDAADRLLAAEGVLQPDRHEHCRAHVRVAAAWALDPASQASGLVHPVAPQAELIEETEAALHRIDCDIDAHVEHGLRHLENVDLETGRLPPAPARETTAAA